MTMKAEKLEAVFRSSPATIVIIGTYKPPPPIPPALEIDAAMKESTAAMIVEVVSSILGWLNLVGKSSHELVLLRSWSTGETKDGSCSAVDGVRRMMMVRNERVRGTKLFLIFMCGVFC